MNLAFTITFLVLEPHPKNAGAASCLKKSGENHGFKMF